MNRHRAILAPLLAVLALLCGLAGTASAAFNEAAQNPYYGEFLLRKSEALTSEWVQPTDPAGENGAWIYDSTLGVPAYVRQNPWSAFDPEGLFEWSKVGQSLLNTASGIGELGQDAGKSIVEIVALGNIGFEANGRFNQKVLNIGKGLADAGGKAVNSAHQAVGGNWSNAGETALTILGETPEEAVANGGLMVLTAGANRYLKGSGSPSSNSARATAELADEIASAGPPRSRQTVALLETKEGKTIAAGGSGDLVDAQKALAAERGLVVADDMPGFHAEITAMQTAGRQGLTPTRGVTTNKVCRDGESSCAGQMVKLAEEGGYKFKLEDDGRSFEFEAD